MPGTTGLAGVVPAGVLTGENVIKLFQHCSDNGVALPAFNCTSSSTINAVLQVWSDFMRKLTDNAPRCTQGIY